MMANGAADLADRHRVAIAAASGEALINIRRVRARKVDARIKVLAGRVLGAGMR